MIRAQAHPGYILLPVVILLALVASVAFMVNHESALDSGITSSQLEAEQAEAVAMAGMNHAQWRLAQQGCGPYTDLTGEPLGKHSYDTALTTDLGSTTSYTINVDQDTWIRSDMPTNNYASDSGLHIRFEAGTIERPMYRYDLSPIVAGSDILSATAWFYVSKEHPEGPVDIHLLNADWTDTDATWDSMGGNMDAAIQATIPAQPAAGAWVAVNLTAQVQAWVNGQPNYGITLNSLSEGTHGDYASIEAAQAPYMEVIVGTPASSPAKLKSKGRLADGTSRLIKRDVTLLQQPSDLILQPDAVDGKDAWLTADKTTWNYGKAGFLRVRAGGGGHWRSPIQFDLGRLPHGARIRSASLELYRFTGTQDAAGLINVHPITNSWVEGDSNGGANPGVTWNSRDTGLPWNTAGGDFDAAPAASIPIDASTDTWYSVDITSLVQQWTNGSRENHGVMLVAGDDVVRAEFSSSDEADPTRWPRLTIRYACACGSSCLAAQGSGNILFVVSDEWFMTAGETAKQALFESWGYTVDPISQWDVSWNFDAKAVNNDVVYISEAVTSTTFGMASKLAATSLGVVNEEGGLNDELGIASGLGWPVGDSFTVADNSHYITWPFATGDLQIFDAAMQGLSVSGSEAAGLQTLADWSGKGGLVVLETGAALDGGGTAPGRRVMLPLGRDNIFNTNYLNANGRLIVQRALAWGLGADKLIGARKLLLVVANAGSPTTQEEAKRALIESWGYTVNLIDDSDSQAAFDSAVAASDAAYVSSTVTETALGTKLKNAAIGVVNEQGLLVDEFGFGFESVNYKTRHEVDVLDNFHYITEPFATGLLTIVSVDQQLHFMTANKGAGFSALGQVFNTGTLWDDAMGVIDTGGALFGGGTAAGRRVLLPWGQADFDVSTLNADGQTIMKRAIEWAATASGPKLPIAHWKLDETGGTTAVDSEGGHDGTLAGGPVWADGRLDGALSFNGNSDYVNVPHDDALSLSDQMTFTAWVRASSYGSGYQTILAKDDSGSGSNYWFGTHQRELVFGFFVNGTFREVFTTGLNLQENTWYHLAATFDNATDTVVLFVDGVPAHKDAITFAPTTVAADLTIGRSQDGEYWPGRLDDVRIYDQLLDVSDVANLAAAPPRVPIAHWRLDETSGTTAVDSIGGHDGTLNNGPVWTGGHLGGALQFDGIDDYVDLTSDVELDDIFVGGATVMAWINPAGWGETDSGRIFDKSSSASSTGDGWAIRINGEEDTIQFGHGFSGGRGWWRSPFDTILLDTWQHVAIAYDASSTANDPVIYINGSPVNVIRVDAPSGDVRSDAAINLRLGNYAGGTTHTFNGLIDDARIYDVMLDASEIAPLAAGGGGGSGPAGCPGTYRDNFDTPVWSGSNGTLDWSTSPWTEVGESDGAGGGDVRVADDSGESRLRIQDNDNGGEGVERVADLDGASTATLSLDYRRDGLDNSNDYVAVSISSTGTAGPWTELVRFQGNGTDAAYQSFSQDISAHISSQTAIRLQSSSNMGGGDKVWFDNVQIECLP